MSGREEELLLLVEKAAGIVSGSQNTVGIRKAMSLVGFTTEEAAIMKWYQKVRRRAAKLEVVEKGKEKKNLDAM